MKAGKNPHQDRFKPFELILTIESKEEAQALFAIFNSVRNTNLLNNDDDIRETIGYEFRITNPKDIIAKGVTYDSFYNGK